MRKENKDALVLCSGGLDSTTCLAIALEQGYNASCLALSYGQRHSIELARACRIAGLYNCDFEVVDLRTEYMEDANCALVNPRHAMPGERTPDEVTAHLNVPGRNLLLLSIAFSKAIVDTASSIWIGANADDAAWPDCSASFFVTLEALFTRLGYEVRIIAPLIEMHKKDIVREAYRLQVPVTETWTCYSPFLNREGQPLPCGRCLACVTRDNAFREYEYENGLRTDEAN